MKPNRSYITPFITLTFLVVGISGVLMLFHILDGYTEVLHEILGILFLVCAIFHIMLNWKALKPHFKKAVFLPALLGVITVSAILVVAEIMYPPIDLQIMQRIIKAPVNDAFSALGIDYDRASAKLHAKGIILEEAERFEDLWQSHRADAEEIIDLLLE